MGRVRSKTANGVQTSYQYDPWDVFIRNLAQNLLRAISTRVYLSMRKEQLVGINHQTIYSSTQYEYDAEMRVIKVKGKRQMKQLLYL